jgi:hypothetical protein
MKVLEPPKGKPTEKIIFWFLQWHKAAYGSPFRFKYQEQLASAAGVSARAVSDLIAETERGTERVQWFVYTGTSADVKDTSEL